MVFQRCRLCLEETEEFVGIFNETFPEMIQTLTSIEVQRNDGLPQFACFQCHQEVKSAMLTRYQILNSYQILLKEINADKCKKTDNEIDAKVYRTTQIDLETSPREFKLQTNDSANFESFICKISSEGNSLKVEEEKTDLISENDFKISSKECVENPDKNALNKNIKFRKKRSKILLRNKIECKRKRPTEWTIIKPEHRDFLKSLARKDRVACPECGKVMFGMNMKNHLITHNYDPVVCNICGKTSKNAQALQDHINYYHKTTPDRFMCDKCGKGYRVRFMLQRHEKKEHGNGEKDYECSICGKKFFEKLHLKSHINITHNKIKAYKCERCGKDFGRRTQFVTHQLVHTKESRYHCQVCGKGFKIKQTMQTHLKGVHGIEEEKTIFCKICQKGFSTPQGLRAHVNSRVHGLEKCEICSEFIAVDYKSVHLRDVHGLKENNAYM